MRIAILTSHPIQYNAPFFRVIDAQPDVAVKVFYSWRGTVDQLDPEFGEAIEWDIPLLEGYEHELVENRSKDPGTHHFGGLHNPGMVPAIEAWRPDLLLVYGWPFRTHIAALRHFRRRVPILFRGDSNLLASGGFFKEKRSVLPWLRRRVLRWVYRHVDGAAYVGRHNREYYVEMGVPESRLFFVPHCIDNDRFARDDAARNEEARRARAELGVGEHSVLVLFAGKFVERKQPLVLLDAVRRASREAGGGLELLFVGNGPLRDALVECAAGEAGVHFRETANQQAMPVVYRTGDILALPSTYETWGLAVNEASACRRPSIVSDRVGCAPDLVVEGETGFCYDHRRDEELVARLVSVAGERERLAAMGRAASAQIGDWSFETAARKLVDAGRRLVEIAGKD